jgi:hypothetical protein
VRRPQQGRGAIGAPCVDVNLFAQQPSHGFPILLGRSLHQPQIRISRAGQGADGQDSSHRQASKHFDLGAHCSS